MRQTEPKISVIVAAYRSGDGINTVIESLDAQTLPQSEFETIIVDDGSPDDTFQRLLALAAERPNLHVSRIENSGWPSRPRNLATEQARGEYVLYMDHDDSLYPSALERIVAFAAETGADLISPKESKTSEVWWAMPALAAGNAADVKADDAIGRILPMVPHKVYRREFLQENRISFPEGCRKLWEDVYFNVEAWAKAERGVAVLADTPVYLWHESGENNSGSYGATDAEFWDRLDELMEFIDHTLSGPEQAVVHKTMLVHQYQGRVLRRLGRQLQDAAPEEVAEAMRRARAIQQRFIPEDWDARLGFFAQPRAWLLRQDRPDLLLELHRAYDGVSMKTRLTSVEWVDGALELTAESRWVRDSTQALGFVRLGDRVLMDLPAELSAALPSEALDVTDRLDRFQQTFGVRARAELITWQLPAQTEVAFVPVDGSAGASAHEEVTLVARSTVRLDPRTAAFGRPLEQTVWDLTTISRWDALTKGSGLSYRGGSLPALVDGLAVVAYPTKGGKLALDLSGRLRDVVLSAALEPEADSDADVAAGLRLGGVHVVGATDRPIDLAWNPGAGGSVSADAVAAEARLVADSRGARVEFGVRPSPGAYRLAVTVGEQRVSEALISVGQRQLRVQNRPPQQVLQVRLRRLAKSAAKRLGLR